MLWVILSILSALVWALVNVVDKYVLEKWIRKPIVPVMMLGIVGLIAALLVYFIRGYSPLSLFNIILALIAGAFYFLMNLSYFKAAQIEEISRVVPLFKLTPIFILILATIFLGEVFTPLRYLGIFLLVIGAILISMKGSFKIRLSKAIFFMLLSAFFLSLNQVITKYLLDFTDFWTVFSYVRFGAFVALIPAFYFNFKDLREVAREHGKKAIGVMSLNESMNLVAVLLITIAVALGSVTLVNALASVQLFFVLFFTIILSVFYPRILKEEITRKTIFFKIIAIVLMFIGALLVI